ncbi:MAG: hypothetical protein GX230_04325 [Lentisphaerae bacterium]|nr:hypothetical protein [Lentisphaerota bacterium]
MKPITTSLFCHLLLVQLSLSILSTYASQTCIWSGLGDGVSWHDAANWSPAPPATGDSVTIDAGTLLLSASTPQLNAFTMSGGTLTFTNWTTTLQASIITLSGNALFTLPAPFSDTDMSNRVSIVCDSLHIDSTSKIDVSGQGFLALSGPAITA